MNPRSVLSLCLMILLLSGGCVRTEPGYYLDVSFDGEVDATSEEFRMSGAITAGGGESKRDVYRNVTLYLLTRNGTVIISEGLGELRGQLQVNVTSSTTPYYVVFNSDDFWTEPKVTVTYYRLVTNDSGREYRWMDATEQDELPLSPTLPNDD